MQDMYRLAGDQTPSLTTQGKMTVMGSGITSGSLIWDWMGTNHEEITALCAMIGAVITVGGFILTWYRGRK